MQQKAREEPGNEATCTYMNSRTHPHTHIDEHIHTLYIPHGVLVAPSVPAYELVPVLPGHGLEGWGRIDKSFANS